MSSDETLKQILSAIQTAEQPSSMADQAKLIVTVVTIVSTITAGAGFIYTNVNKLDELSNRVVSHLKEAKESHKGFADRIGNIERNILQIPHTVDTLKINLNNHIEHSKEDWDDHEKKHVEIDRRINPGFKR